MSNYVDRLRSIQRQVQEEARQLPVAEDFQKPDPRVFLMYLYEELAPVFQHLEQERQFFSEPNVQNLLKQRDRVSVSRSEIFFQDVLLSRSDQRVAYYVVFRQELDYYKYRSQHIRALATKMSGRHRYRSVVEDRKEATAKAVAIIRYSLDAPGFSLYQPQRLESFEPLGSTGWEDFQLGPLIKQADDWHLLIDGVLRLIAEGAHVSY